VSVTQQQVLDSLKQVASPRGVPLTNANVLSAISVTDGKVFFSINVDAAEARAWESVRAQAEAAVRAIPGVTAAMIALTAERKPGSPPPAPAPHRHAHGVQPVAAHRPPQGAASPIRNRQDSGVAAVIAVARAGGARQVDHRTQPGAGFAIWATRRPARCRHLRVGATADRHQ
jgi:ATP-binding protein involved in chromosome partitioning